MAKKKKFDAILGNALSKSDTFSNETIKVDQEFKQLIPALTEEEKFQLEQNLIKEGVREPLVVWEEENILLDGHNRFEISQNNNLSFKVSRQSFTSREEAKDWMIANQLGKRNLTNEQKSYLRGLRYLSDKQQGKRSDLTSGQNVQKSTATIIADQYNVDEKTVRRDAQYAKGVDLIGKSNPELKSAILKGDAKINKSDVQKLAGIENKKLNIQSAQDIKKILTKHSSSKTELAKSTTEGINANVKKIRNKIFNELDKYISTGNPKSFDQIINQLEALKKEIS
ncbi:hypothetical protein [Flexithrix dorotheae]|uniref:hypothetical protein n=1 Tax=Flexithrix dorotheae TaxID=70993 RepID=UPI0003657029|nr:hypothetical protein [Flexithrix dorotheae]